ncbi:repetitive organellar protein-like isoform X2 [Crassostrea angulata]|uniref:repetitive organellar protein-like isoform X2 n=1 Tax=Magallana angulata TaxID=2784310 RepID=UPI0022B1B77A|nr:repetitive organellar protein-like isoform X2 [Crassostrea angulata]
MPRRRAAQNAASKISDIADKENDSSVKKTRTAKSSAGKSLKEQLIKKTSGQNEEITCSKAEQQEIQTKEKRTDLTIESGKENKSDKPAKEKKRKPKKDQETLSTDKIADEPRKNWSENDVPKVKRSQPEKPVKEDTVSRGKTKPRPKQASTKSTIVNSEATMTVAQKTKNREPHLYQVKKPSNIKTDPDDDDVDSLKAKPKTRHKKESKINPKETTGIENNNTALNDIKKTKVRATGRKKNRTEQDENDNDYTSKGQSPNGGLVMKPDLSHSNKTLEPLKVDLPKGEQKIIQDRPKKLGQSKKLKSSEQIEEDILGVRSQISQWWDKCYYGKEQRTLCRPFFDENLTSSNLTALKKEEAKLRKFYEKNRHIFDNIHESLQRDTKQSQGPSSTSTDYKAEILTKEKELQDCQTLHQEIFHQLESQLEEKEKKIYQLEKNIKEMKSHQTKLCYRTLSIFKQPPQEKDHEITTPRTTEEYLNSTYTKENDCDFGKKKNQSATTCNNEDFHEVNVLYEFCQKQKKTIRNLEREIELMRQERRKQANDFSEPGGLAE